MAERYLSPWVSDDEQSLAATKATEQRKKLAEERRKKEEEERRRNLEEEMRRTHEEAEQRWSYIQAGRRRKEREKWEAYQRETEAKRQRLRELLASIESGTTRAGAMEVRDEIQSPQIRNKRKRGPESITSPDPGNGVDPQGLKKKAPCDRCVASRRSGECVLRTDTTKARSCVPCHRKKLSCSYNADRATRNADSQCGRYQEVNEKLLVMNRQVMETMCLVKKMREEIEEVSRVIRGG
ncbi:hypothetical protein DFJ43DRAFT_1102397 [Lentinula guzmanii]|uniref:Uncharacterized protein n=1 Tax=Lentinula guzmanii TaxID=2804957 RepID=A0AA38JG64_9AGAR|nr:hypothetical protein DFJ43DRAFT_1102397 [Lentinula guzmanii]